MRGNATLHRDGLGNLAQSWRGGRFFKDGIEFGFIYVIGSKNHKRSLWRAVAIGFEPSNFTTQAEARQFVEEKFKEKYG